MNAIPMLLLASTLALSASAASAAEGAAAKPCESSATTDCFCVNNRTGTTIYVVHEAWYSGDLKNDTTSCFLLKKDANVTVWEKAESGDVELGKTWIPRDKGCLAVKGSWHWQVRKGLTQVDCSKL
jgi:hypothetical protein